MNILGILIILFYFEFKLCLPYNELEKNRFCVINYSEQVTVEEPYNHTYTKPELQLCYHGYRYYNCWRDVVKTEKRMRTVVKEVPRTKVECCSGYRTVTVHKEVFHCEPICEPACIKGQCVAPGNCTCFHGYQHLNNYECGPVCKPDCVNGRCTSPGQCECDLGYDKVNSSYCAPHCSKECSNGICHKPEECLCNAGYKQSSKRKLHCEPVCEKGCYNATCTAPDVCSCWNGYAKNSSNTCIPTCDLECLYGDCVAPNKCFCNQGYKMKINSSNICEPVCDNCKNGFCSRPNECVCFENYTRNEDGLCEPDCHNCTNGKCFVPNECECSDGYEKNDEGECAPVCSSCSNGNCTQPEVCTCFDGYENRLETECYPVCKAGCGGGECISPNNCSCEEFDRVEENFCFPLQQNGTNMTDSIQVKKLEIKMSKISETIDLSSVYIKINCSYVNKFGNTSLCALDKSSEFSISCSLILHPRGFKWLCIWERFSPDTLTLYEEFLPKIVANETLNLSFPVTKVFGLTVLLPKDITTDDGSCYMCPCQKKIRFPESRLFNVSLIPCQYNQYHFESRSHDWKSIVGLPLAVLAIIAIAVSSVMLYCRRKRTHDYLVHSSSEQHMDDIVDMAPISSR